VPDRPVIGFCGDGGFYYHIAELEVPPRASTSRDHVVNKQLLRDRRRISSTRPFKGRQRGRAKEDVDFATR
jgi:hypothetical protein